MSDNEEQKIQAKKLFDEFFSPERKRDFAQMYLDLLEGDAPPPLIADIVNDWLAQ